MSYTEKQFIKLPYLLLHKIGIIPTTVLVHLMELQRNAFGNGEFYQQQNRVADSLGLSTATIKRTIKKLKSLGLIKVQKKSVNGQPPKNFYDVNVTLYKKMLEETVSVKSTQSLVQNEPIVSSNCTQALVQNEPIVGSNCTQSLVQNEPTNTILRETILSNTILSNTRKNKTRNDLVTSTSNINEMSFADIFNNGIDIDINEFLNNK